ncbi:prepilin peptidase [Jannaschia seohaensis]|uniref:Prepilin leader peptidase/N-methyltransferase n=1 Tax=Jannaschia seohaensis TaxID=475081 RepID=A0A2Y9AYW2_9RHOB|nr:A24 family peptidase [Jannaschia seohaensis]PWJ15790.1 leader peptidase (prepilin peptidase)/N-methyltransferase [Jannaschia seohaensis]SSA49474.1 leader peptidase (prepilin peptidase) / N-methyltransferase [Jannaschia seohaensis]
MQADVFLATLLILAGPAIGSFLAVLVDRLPRGEDVVAARSRCRACGTVLSGRDLVPILSYLAARGRCRHCGAAIPGTTLLLEIGALGVAGLAVLAGGGAAQMGLSALWLWLLLALAAADLTWMRLPDPLTALLLVVALGIALLPGGLGLGPALLGALLGSGAFLALRAGYARLRGREGLGLGDVKLMAGLGAFSGPLDLPLLTLIGAALALAAVLLTRGPLEGTRPLPFGAALCAAGSLLWLLRAGGLAI